MKNNTIHPFNNKIETGLRILAILNASFPKSFDLQSLVYLDYLTVHSGDVMDGISSLHPAVSSRKGEMFVRHSLIQESMDVFENKGLIEKIYNKNGIEYLASENSTPFIESLSEEYFYELNIRANWITSKFGDFSAIELNVYMQKYMSNDSNNININLVSNG